MLDVVNGSLAILIKRIPLLLEFSYWVIFSLLHCRWNSFRDVALGNTKLDGDWWSAGTPRYLFSLFLHVGFTRRNQSAHDVTIGVEIGARILRSCSWRQDGLYQVFEVSNLILATTKQLSSLLPHPPHCRTSRTKSPQQNDTTPRDVKALKWKSPCRDS